MKIDPTIELVRSVYSKPVPLQSELSNPFNSNKRRKKTANLQNTNEIPENINEWGVKDFCRYFAQEYKSNIGGMYKITFSSDTTLIHHFQEFMEDNKLDKLEHTKKFIDWCFLNKAIILQQSGHVLLTSFRQFLNRYYQDTIASKNTSFTLIDIYSELLLMDKNGKQREIYSKFGIPIASTYFINKKNITEESVIENLKILFETLAEGTSDQKRLLGDVFQKSINRSPYIETMNLLNWREVFLEIIAKYKNEVWWKEEDYPGNPRFDFNKLIE